MMNRAHRFAKGTQQKSSGRFQLAQAVQYLERWAASHEQVEFVSWQAGYTTIHLGIVIVNEALNDKKEFELIAKSGMRVLLDPSSWEHVRTRKYPVETVQVAPRVGVVGGFLLHPPYSSVRPNSQMRNAEEQMLSWTKSKTELVVNVGLGFCSFFFCGTVEESGSNQFAFKNSQTGNFCMVIPRLCDRVDIERSGAHSIMRMIDKKTEVWFEISDCASRPQDVLSGFPMISKARH